MEVEKKKKKKKKKITPEERAKRWLTAAIVFIIFVAYFGVSSVINHKDFYVKSRTGILEKRQKNDKDDKKTEGWIRVQGTNIDFPVLYAPGYDFLYETEDFAWSEAEYEKLNNIVYISGHNIKNMSRKPMITNKNHGRFEQLMSFTYYSFAKDNQFIQYTFGKENYVYQIFAVAYIDGSDLDLYNENEYSPADIKELVETAKNESIYKYDIDIRENDKIISLDTCTNMFGDSDNTHFVIFARLLRDGEKEKFVKVKTTNQYKVIKDQMKGGDSNDEA